jgi:hypothetical protein
MGIGKIVVRRFPFLRSRKARSRINPTAQGDKRLIVQKRGAVENRGAIDCTP